MPGVRQPREKKDTMIKPASLITSITFLLTVSLSAHADIIVSSESWGGNTSHLIAKDEAGSPYSWNEAEAFSVSLGGHLVTIDSEPENQFIFSTFGDTDPDNFGVWIGLSDVASEGNFTWSSGTALGYTNWMPGQPDNNGNQDFGYLIDPDNPNFGSVTGQWDDGRGPRIYGIAEVTGVPEPGSLAILLFGTGLLAVRRCRAK